MVPETEVQCMYDIQTDMAKCKVNTNALHKVMQFRILAILHVLLCYLSQGPYMAPK
jgi:hypothetical protein